ncbi:MAG TPA: head GIN domain-containing protein [Phycisphaerae bacterium]|nr:head GIN domain-containing protein [Phycisphaerae bacterium]
MRALRNGLGGFILALCLAASGCSASLLFTVFGDGVAKTENRTVADFTQLELLGSGRVEVTMGELGPLEITADENILPYVETKVENGRLYISPERVLQTVTPLVIQVTVPNVRNVRITGTGEIVVSGIDNTYMSASVIGTGVITLDGQTETLVVDLNGAGRVSAGALAANDVSIEIDGVGTADVQAAQTLDVVIAGSGVVTYSGAPTITQNITGTGRLEKNE